MYEIQMRCLLYLGVVGMKLFAYIQSLNHLKVKFLCLILCCVPVRIVFEPCLFQEKFDPSVWATNQKLAFQADCSVSNNLLKLPKHLVNCTQLTVFTSQSAVENSQFFGPSGSKCITQDLALVSAGNVRNLSFDIVVGKPRDDLQLCKIGWAFAWNWACCVVCNAAFVLCSDDVMTVNTQSHLLKHQKSGKLLFLTMRPNFWWLHLDGNSF